MPSSPPHTHSPPSCGGQGAGSQCAPARPWPCGGGSTCVCVCVGGGGGDGRFLVGTMCGHTPTSPHSPTSPPLPPTPPPPPHPPRPPSPPPTLPPHPHPTHTHAHLCGPSRSSGLSPLLQAPPAPTGSDSAATSRLVYSRTAAGGRCGRRAAKARYISSGCPSAIWCGRGGRRRRWWAGGRVAVHVREGSGYITSTWKEGGGGGRRQRRRGRWGGGGEAFYPLHRTTWATLYQNLNTLAPAARSA
mgnify:CR=1 FL=1